jgi:hypothetical protein
MKQCLAAENNSQLSIKPVPVQLCPVQFLWRAIMSIHDADSKGGPLYRWLSLYAFSLSAVLFQYHEEHQFPIRGHGRSCRAGPLGYTDSPHHFDTGDYKLRPLMAYHSENTRACYTFPFYGFSIHAVIRRKAYPAYNERYLYCLPTRRSDVKADCNFCSLLVCSRQLWCRLNSKGTSSVLTD